MHRLPQRQGSSFAVPTISLHPRRPKPLVQHTSLGMRDRLRSLSRAACYRCRFQAFFLPGYCATIPFRSKARAREISGPQSNRHITIGAFCLEVRGDVATGDSVLPKRRGTRLGGRVQRSGTMLSRQPPAPAPREGRAAGAPPPPGRARRKPATLGCGRSATTPTTLPRRHFGAQQKRQRKVNVLPCCHRIASRRQQDR